MDLSAAKAPGGGLSPFQANLRRLAAEVVNNHLECRTGHVDCDLYHNLIEVMQDLAFEMIQGERLPMICGHPVACSDSAGACSACAREQRLLAQAQEMKRV